MNTNTNSQLLDDFLTRIRGRLIVSCQAPTGHALRESSTIARMARAAQDGGAAAVRCGGVGGLPDVAAVAAAVTVPVIGLTKEGTEGVYITPTVASALDVLHAGADVVAADGTDRPRPDGSALADLVAAVHEAGGLLMADVSTLREGIAAYAAGADLVATTLSGYTPYSTPATANNANTDGAKAAAHAATAGPDLALLAALRRALPDAPLVAEGRYHSPASAAAAIAAGATSVVVGTAITDPAWITRSFAAAVQGPAA
jgi:N-acylglucosamine-6-phosphate 2-epimerase